MVFQRILIASFGVVDRTTKFLTCLIVFNGLRVSFAPSPGIGDYFMPGHHGTILKWADSRGFSDLENAADGDLDGEERETGKCVLECLKLLELRVPDKEKPETVKLFGVMDQRHDAFIGCADICPEDIEVTCQADAMAAENTCTGSGSVQDAKGQNLGKWKVKIESHKGPGVIVNFEKVPGESQFPILKKKWRSAFARDDGIAYVVDMDHSSSLLFLRDEVKKVHVKDNIAVEDPSAGSSGSSGESGDQQETQETDVDLDNLPFKGKTDGLGRCMAFGMPLKQFTPYLPLHHCKPEGDEEEIKKEKDNCNVLVMGMEASDGRSTAATGRSCLHFCAQYEGYTCQATYDITDQTMDKDESTCAALQEKGNERTCESQDGDKNYVICKCARDIESESSEDELEGVEVEVTPEDLRGATCSFDMMAPTVCSDIYCCSCPDTMELVVVTKVYKKERAVPWTPTHLRNLLACACSSDEENPTPASEDEDKKCQCEPGEEGDEPPEPEEKGEGFICPPPDKPNEQSPWKLWKEGGEQGESWLTKELPMGPNGEIMAADLLWRERNPKLWNQGGKGGGSDDEEGKKKKGGKGGGGGDKGGTPSVKPSLLALPFFVILVLTDVC